MKEFFLCTVMAVLLIAPLPASAAVYYVAQNGSDGNPGSESHPWLTIQKAADELVAGDTVFVRAGTYHERVEPRNSGEPESQISYQAYPGDNVTIDGTDIDASQWDEGVIHIEEKSHIRIEGFRIANATDAGILVAGSSHIAIQGNHTYNTHNSGMIIWSCNNILIDTNEIEQACNGGAESSNECMSVGETDSVEIVGNYVHHGNTIRGEGIDVKDGSSNARIYGNTVHNVMFVGIYIDAWDKHTHNIDVFRNTVHDIAGDGMSIGSEQGGLLENIRVYNNIVFHNEWVGISIHNCCTDNHPLDNIQIVNNTLFDNGLTEWGGGIVDENPQAENVIIRNNICSENLSFQIALEGVSLSEVVADHNLIDGYRDYPGEIRGNDFIEGDAGFVDPSAEDFYLQENSLAIDNGSSESAPTDDFNGNPRPYGSGWDIGAYEFIGQADVLDLLSVKPDVIVCSTRPNPFHTLCRIDVTTGMRVSIFDVSGRRVFYFSLASVEGTASGGTPGFTSLVWRPSEDMAGGVYVVRAVMGQHTSEKRIIYLK